MADSIANSWPRIEAWLNSNAPDAAKRLHPGASDEQIAALDATLAVALPDDLKESLRIHNGAEELGVFPSSDTSGLDLMAFSPLTAEEIANEWKMWKGLIDGGEFEDRTTNPTHGICSDWWSNSWIPIATNGSGDFQCVDLAPTESGTVGQIIGAWHDDDERQLIASSLADYLQWIADGLENGKYEFEEDEGIIQADDDEDEDEL
ncbi:MAG: SMI1/KNR4 family protein [Planctomycetes bacterium]|nr:SMI1/KNR4 family protein [Planctomycetota bacterium]